MENRLKCLECNKLLGINAKRNKTSFCGSCVQRGERNKTFKNGSHLRTPKICPICTKNMDSRSKVYINCSIQQRIGVFPANKIDGRTTKKYCCKDCGKELKRYNNIRCKNVIINFYQVKIIQHLFQD